MTLYYNNERVKRQVFTKYLTCTCVVIQNAVLKVNSFLRLLKKKPENKLTLELYLSSLDYIDFEFPRKILHFRKDKVGNRNTLIVEVDIPVIGQEYGYGATDINTFYLINRFDENAFNKLDTFPIHVHVFIQMDKKTSPPTSLSDMINIAWACLYDSEEDARNHR